ncbi:hypothetical protein CDL12_19210 [Handroanthus impetiginosus]|uniref:RING-type domain-containing protein n=1 Tax=Handroanthus impetiginosus TaxID=429701 RepID=A0A2G9GSC7_9LAMI|nr:hypothetical protein CDL12_23768 [Handroanthus impetiginosus]PIN08217.1 hypothetical protein CDL12_19210 [Handroanthus impetiginosus]
MEFDGGHNLKAELGGGARPFNEQLGRTESNRTLLDIIREEGGGPKDGKKSWRHFKDKLRRHNSGGRGSNWTSTVPVPASDIPINNSNNNRMMARHPSTRINSNLDLHATNQADIPAAPDARVSNLLRNSSISMGRASGRFDNSTRLSMRKLQREENGSDDEEEEDEENEESDGGGSRQSAEEAEEEERPVRMSLMSLLAETDNGLMGYMDEEDDDDEEDDGVAGGGVEYSNCCVCMVRHKGTAFEPCGHSFCRLCSRELGVQSGKCPLCNNYILEILDIF